MPQKDNTYLELLGEDICEVYLIKRNNAGNWEISFRLNKPYKGKQAGLQHTFYRFHENDAKEIFDFLYNSMVNKTKRNKLRILTVKQKMMFKEFSERKKFDAFRKILGSTTNLRSIQNLELIPKNGICKVSINHHPKRTSSLPWVITFKLDRLFKGKQAGGTHFIVRRHENDAKDVYEFLYYSMMSKIFNNSCKTKISSDEQKEMMELFYKFFPKEIS